MRGRSRRKKRTGKMVSLQKRFLAFMLAFAMIFTNVGTDLHDEHRKYSGALKAVYHFPGIHLRRAGKP